MNIFFYCAKYKSPSSANYQHSQVALAEGLVKLGNNIYSNVNYWSKKDGWLFGKSDDIQPKMCDVVVYNSKFLKENKVDISNSNGSINVLLDQLDEFGLMYRKEVKKFDIVLRSHMSKWVDYPENYFPWPFGITNRIKKYTKGKSNNNKKEKVIKNYRVGHEIRSIADMRIVKNISNFINVDSQVDRFEEKPKNERDLELWKMTGRRHYPKYYERLGKSLATLAFGGFFLPPSIFMLNYSLSKAGRKLVNSVLSKMYELGVYPKKVGQWDSFRLWEAWAAGSVPIHLDFEKYGFLLPVYPSNMRHYIGVDLNSPDTAVKVFRDTKKVKDIAIRGRKWAYKHYGPMAQARRFLEMVSNI